MNNLQKNFNLMGRQIRDTRKDDVKNEILLMLSMVTIYLLEKFKELNINYSMNQLCLFRVVEKLRKSTTLHVMSG